ncbi:MAG: hypothetical protein ABGZ53_12380, partial [Fuerstiella sp.]
MHDYNKPLEAAGREVGESSSRGLAQCSNALQSMVTSSTQHGSRLADSTQPSTGQRQCGREPEGNVEGVCPERHVDGCVACQPCETERLASVGDTPSQRRQPVHPEGKTNMVKPQGP